jgi:hypothetical protein
LYATLPSRLLFVPRFVVPVLEAVVLIPLLLGNPTRFTREDRRLRRVSIGLIVALAVVNTVALGLLVQALVDAKAHGAELLVGALQVWATNVLAFALLYWELDRGGPVIRSTWQRSRLPMADFRFPQDEDADAIPEVAARSAGGPADWRPEFVDYLYLSLTNSTAFSPTDTMPLSPRAKLLMSYEGMVAFLLSILVIARAVNILS